MSDEQVRTDRALVFDRLHAAAEALSDFGASLNANDLRTIALLFDESEARLCRAQRTNNDNKE